MPIGTFPYNAGEQVAAAALNSLIRGPVMTLLAGETIAAGKAVAVVDDFQQPAHYNVATDGTIRFGSDTGNRQKAVSFRLGKGVTALQFCAIFLRKVGSPTDNITIEIQTDSGGFPSGTVIANGTSAVLVGSGLTTFFVRQLMSWSATRPVLVAETTYWLVFKRSGAIDNSNYYEIDGSNGTTISGWTGKSTSYAHFKAANLNVSSVWEANNSIPAFHLHPVVGEGDVVQSFRTWLCDSSHIGMSNFFGIADTAGTSGSTHLVRLAGGVDNNQSGLITGVRYYVNTFGARGELVAEGRTLQQFTPVGMAISATEIKMFNTPKVFTGKLSPTQAINSFFLPCGFRPRRLRIFAAFPVVNGMATSEGVMIDAGAVSFQSFCFYTTSSALGTGVSGITTDKLWELRLTNGGITSDGIWEGFSEVGVHVKQTTALNMKLLYEAIGY